MADIQEGVMILYPTRVRFIPLEQDSYEETVNLPSITPDVLLHKGLYYVLDSHPLRPVLKYVEGATFDTSKKNYI